MSDSATTANAGQHGTIRARLFVRGAALVAAALSLLALTGWVTGNDLLTRLAPGLPSMKVNAALAFLLLSVSFWRATLGRSRVPLVGAPLAIGLASLTLGQTLFGINLGLDNWLLRDLGGPEVLQPGRMPMMTSVAVVMLGLSIWSVQHGPPGWRRWRLWPTAVALGIGYLASIGFLIGVEWSGLLGLAMGGLSLPTATIVLLLGSAIIRLHDVPDGAPSQRRPRGLSHAGARFAVVALPLALLFPAGVGWLREVTVRQGLLAPTDGQALAFAALGLLFGLLALCAAAWVSELEESLRALHVGLERRVDERTEQLRQAEQRAEHARMRLADIVQKADVAIVSVDAGQRVVVFNRAAEVMFGHAAEAMIGQPLDRLLPPAVRDGHDAWMTAFAQSGGAPRRMGAEERQLHGMRADGQRFPLEASIARSDSGDERLLTAVLRDLTAAQALEAERHARREAEAANRAKSQQLGVVGHELRTPLGAVIGFSDLLLSDVALTVSDGQRNYIREIHKAGQHMLRLIGDLTELSQIDAGQTVLTLEPVDAGHAVKDAARLLAPVAAEASVTIAVDTDAQAWVAADALRLRQVLINLASNAIKYNRPGGRVLLGVRSGPDRVCTVQVVDNGLGLTEEQQAQLFEPFNRLGRESSGIEGTGLGLALSHRLMQAMGGRIEVRSELGVGSTFELHLPGATPPQG